MWRVSKSRLQHWPQLEKQHIHEVPRKIRRCAQPFGGLGAARPVAGRQVSFSSKPQRFCETADAEALGDPAGNIFIINLLLAGHGG